MKSHRVMIVFLFISGCSTSFKSVYTTRVSRNVWRKRRLQLAIAEVIIVATCDYKLLGSRTSKSLIVATPHWVFGSWEEPRLIVTPENSIFLSWILIAEISNHSVQKIFKILFMYPKISSWKFFTHIKIFTLNQLFS